MPLAEKARVADYVIDNSGTREETERQVRDGLRAPSWPTCSTARRRA